MATGASKPTKPVIGPPAITRRPGVASVLCYRLTPDDARDIADRRTRESKLFRYSLGEPVGTVAQSGDVLPLIVTFAGESEVRGRVLLDGDGSLWVKSRHEGPERGQWRWPDAESTEG